MLHFRATVYALPPATNPGPQRTLRHLELPTLAGETNGPPLFTEPLPVTFDSMQQQLLENDRCDCEPDGFFLLTGHHSKSLSQNPSEGIQRSRKTDAPDGWGTCSKTFWRVNGHMHEHNGKMHRVELSGECPEESLDILLRTMGWPTVSLVFELVEEGVTLSEENFRRYATACESRVVPIAARVTFPPPPAQPFPTHTAWHITFGTYGTRLHGDPRPTVDRDKNEYGTPFQTKDTDLQRAMEESLAHPPVRLTQEQRELIEHSLPEICERGGWTLRAIAAAEDHVHIVLDIKKEIHGERVRRLLKRWLTEALDTHWPRDEGTRWWATQGSNKAIKDASYLRNAVAYVERQRTVR